MPKSHGKFGNCNGKWKIVYMKNNSSCGGALYEHIQTTGISKLGPFIKVFKYNLKKMEEI